MHTHSWTAWSTPFDTSVEKPASGFGETYKTNAVCQARTCKSCGLIDVKTVFEGKILEDLKRPIKEESPKKPRVITLPTGLLRDILKASYDAILNMESLEISATCFEDLLIRVLANHDEDEVRKFFIKEVHALRDWEVEP